MVLPGGGGAGEGLPWTVFCVQHSPRSLRRGAFSAAVLLRLCSGPLWLPTLSPLLALTAAQKGAPCTDPGYLHSWSL